MNHTADADLLLLSVRSAAQWCNEVWTGCLYWLSTLFPSFTGCPGYLCRHPVHVTPYPIFRKDESRNGPRLIS